MMNLVYQSRYVDLRTDSAREVMEALAIDGYRTGAFTHYQASQLLGLSCIAFDGFLKDRHIHDRSFDMVDLTADREASLQLQA